MKTGVIRLVDENEKVIQNFHYSSIKERNKIIAAWEKSICAIIIAPNL